MTLNNGFHYLLTQKKKINQSVVIQRYIDFVILFATKKFDQETIKHNFVSERNTQNERILQVVDRLLIT